MEAEKCHHLLSASLRAGKTGRIQSESQGLRTRCSMSEGRSRSLLKRREGIRPSSAFFVPFRSSADWMMSANTGKGDLYSVHGIKR